MGALGAAGIRTWMAVSFTWGRMPYTVMSDGSALPGVGGGDAGTDRLHPGGSWTRRRCTSCRSSLPQSQALEDDVGTGLLGDEGRGDRAWSAMLPSFVDIAQGVSSNRKIVVFLEVSAYSGSTAWRCRPRSCACLRSSREPALPRSAGWWCLGLSSRAK